jgi:uncharacterized alpha-E superfamily protein
MLSRVADSIYWMNRYIERAENVARFVDVNHRLMLDLPAMSADQQWLPMVITTGDRAFFETRYKEPTRENVTHFLAFDGENANSILSCVRVARENARTVRETISSEMWQEINRFYQFVEAAARSDTPVEEPQQFFSEIKLRSHLLAGVTDATMTHSEGWHFGRLGRLLERADKTSRILDVKYFMLLPRVEYVGTALDKIQWAAVLKSASGLEMYRKQYQHIAPEHVAEFLALDRLFPRAMHYCLIKAEESLHAITGTDPGTFRNRAEQQLGRLRAWLDFLTIDEIISGGLHEFLDRFQSDLNDAGSAISDTFFALRPVMQRQEQVLS